jgi:glycine/serine hydroxymethyltransferase
MKEDEMGVIAGFINEALINTGNGKVLSRIKDDVRELCHKFPMYRDRLV